MTALRLLQLLYAPDATDLAQTIRQRLADLPGLEIGDGRGDLPESSRQALFVALLSPGALADPDLPSIVRGVTDGGWPMLPVVPVRNEYDFSGLPETLASLGRINAVGWDQGTEPGGLALTAIRRLLGLEPFKRDCQLFISYRRSDGAEVAGILHQYLSAQGYQAFLDTEDIDYGDWVQSRIHHSIPERDFLLLINSPKAAESPWVREEVEVALERRVSVFVIDLPGAQRFHLLRDLAGLFWEGADPGMAARAEREIALRLASRAGFDQRVSQILRQLARKLNLQCESLDKRRLLLSGVGPPGPQYLVDYEDAMHSLDRLYRLYQGYVGRQPLPDTAILVHSGLPLSSREREAVVWAAGEHHLRVAALEELFELLATGGEG